MADIRINALATTATTPASDDFLALDGTAQGTRKILATNIANNVTDVVFGTSGPSAKSSIAARAARQGLVFDGTSGATVASVPAFGTGDFTFAAWVRQTSLAAAYLCSASAARDSAFLYLVGNGTFQWWSNSAARATSSAGAFVANKWTLLVATRTGGTTTLYANGVSVGSGPDTQNLASAIDRIGEREGGTNILNGSLVPLIYNRALSAAEVVSLYEAGVPSGADYNTASNTAFNTSNFVEAIAYTTFTGVSATGFSATQTGAVTSIVVTKPNITINAGNRVLVTFTGTLTSGAVPNIALITAANGVASNISAVAAGSNSVVLTATAPCVGVGFYTTGAATSYAISNVVATRLGLLLAPDAAQAGGGLTWYDTSGNAANITLPASGVSWNVPSSLKVGGNWTFGGNLTVSGTGTNLFGGGSRDAFVIESDTAGNGAFASAKNAAANDYEPLLLIGETITLKYRSGVNSSTAGLTLTSTGNLLIGTTTDGGQKLQVNGTASFTDTITAVKSLNGDFSNFITNVNTGTASEATLYVSNAGTGATSATLGVTGTGYTTTGGFVQDAGVVSSGTGLSGGLSIMARAASSDIRFYAGAHTNLVATFASTGNATFTGAIAIGNTVNTVSPTSPNRTITMVIGGVTYYLHAKTTND